MLWRLSPWRCSKPNWTWFCPSWHSGQRRPWARIKWSLEIPAKLSNFVWFCLKLYLNHLSAKAHPSNTHSLWGPYSWVRRISLTDNAKNPLQQNLLYKQRIKYSGGTLTNKIKSEKEVSRLESSVYHISIFQVFYVYF